MRITLEKNEELSMTIPGDGTIIDCSGHCIVSGRIGDNCTINAKSVHVTGRIGSHARLNVEKATISGRVGFECKVNGDLHITESAHYGSGLLCTGTRTGQGSASATSATHEDQMVEHVYGDIFGGHISGSRNMVFHGAVNGLSISGRRPASSLVQQRSFFHNNVASDVTTVRSEQAARPVPVAMPAQAAEPAQPTPFTYSSQRMRVTFRQPSAPLAEQPNLISFNFDERPNRDATVVNRQNMKEIAFGYKNYSIQMTISGPNQDQVIVMGESTMIAGKPFIEFIQQYQDSNENIALFLAVLASLPAQQQRM